MEKKDLSAMSNNTVEVDAGGVKESDRVILRTESISISFGGLQALMDVSFSVKKDEILGLIGPNGAGKTVLLNCLNGLYLPELGSIFFDGQEVTGISPERLAHMGIGRSFQQIELFSNLTVIENLLIGRHFRMGNGILSSGIYWGYGRREELRAREVTEKIIDFLELYQYRKMKVRSLPFGIQKIVGLGRALAMEPKILLLDEIGSGLNREEKEDLARFLLRIHYQKKIPIVWVEHDLKMVSQLVDHLICLNYGRKIADGPPEVVINDPAVIEAYTGVSKE